MTDNTTEAGCNTPATGAVGSLVDQGVGRLFDEQGDFCGQQSYLRRGSDCTQAAGPQHHGCGIGRATADQ